MISTDMEKTCEVRMLKKKMKKKKLCFKELLRLEMESVLQSLEETREKKTKNSEMKAKGDGVLSEM